MQLELLQFFSDGEGEPHEGVQLTKERGDEITATESQRRAKNAYKGKIKRLFIELYQTDEDIKQQLADRNAAGEATATYIKRLIREDMKNGA